jgi:hypothetical protein
MASTVVIVGSIFRIDAASSSIVLEDAAALALRECGPEMLASAIDSDGVDALFNRHQRERLVLEMRSVAESRTDEAVSQNILAVAEFIEAQWSSDRYSQYVVFIAD